VASIVLEELGIDYETVALKIQTNVQKEEWFLKIKCVCCATWRLVSLEASACHAKERVYDV
jgi:hypothetical protein